MMNKVFFYFTLAALPSLVQAQEPPDTKWAWFRLVATSVSQGLLAVKALQTQAPPKE